MVTEPLAVGGASVLLRQDVRGPQGSCAVLTVRLACVKPGEGKPGRLPPRWRSGSDGNVRGARRTRRAPNEGE